MNPVSRRKLLYTGLGAAAGAAGLTTAARLAQRYGLIPPDHGGLYGPGETLTYACQRVLSARTPAREFPRSMISKQPFMNEIGKPPVTPSRLRRPPTSPTGVSPSTALSSTHSHSLSQTCAPWQRGAKSPKSPARKVGPTSPSGSARRSRPYSAKPASSPKLDSSPISLFSPTGGTASTSPTPFILARSSPGE